MANLAFGGHVLWGDVRDKLSDIYDCSRPLPEIPGPGGRAAIPAPAVTTSCYIAGDIVAIVTAVALAGCTPLAIIHVFGTGASALCQSVLSTAQAVLLTSPFIQGLTLHGGERFASGAFKAGDVLKES